MQTAAVAAGALFQLVLLLSFAGSGLAVSSSTWYKESAMFTKEMHLPVMSVGVPGGLGSLRNLQQFFTLKPQCVWEDGACNPSLTNWAMYPGQPSSPYRTAMLIAASRAEQCAKAKDASACNADEVNRCYWFTGKNNQTQQACRSSDYAELLYWADQQFAAEATALPAIMMCPGSKAAEFYACYGRAGYKDSCKHMRSCYATTLDKQEVCFPKWMANYTQPQFTAFWKSLSDLDPKLYGNCAAACWINEAKACSAIVNEANCEKKPYCIWLARDSSCSHTTWEFTSDYDKKVSRLYGMCYETENQKECEAHVDPKLSQQSAAEWAKYKVASEAVQCKL